MTLTSCLYTRADDDDDDDDDDDEEEEEMTVTHATMMLIPENLWRSRIAYIGYSGWKLVLYEPIQTNSHDQRIISISQGPQPQLLVAL